MVCVAPIWIRRTRLLVPCGKCGSCLERKISDYTIRCKEEAKNSYQSFFVTLTYEKDPVQLYRRDLQTYFKRMRKAGARFSYFALGDYGDKFGRPHYHVLVFLKSEFPKEYFYPLWLSGRDQTRRRGFVKVDPLTPGRICYVVAYGFLAKLDGPKDGRQKPFFLISKRPAIGAAYLTREIKRWHKRGDRWYYLDHRWKKPLPRYFRDKIFSLLERQKHYQDELLRCDQARDELMRSISKDNSDPERVYYERLDYHSQNVLEALRIKKNRKQLK